MNNFYEEYNINNYLVRFSCNYVNRKLQIETDVNNDDSNADDSCKSASYLVMFAGVYNLSIVVGGG